MKYKLFIIGGYSWFCMLLVPLGVHLFIENPTYENFIAMMGALGASLVSAWAGDSAWKKYTRPDNVIITKDEGQVTLKLGDFDSADQAWVAAQQAGDIASGALVQAGYKLNSSRKVRETDIKE